MISEMDPGLRALIFFTALGFLALLWGYVTDRQFTRKYGPDPK